MYIHCKGLTRDKTKTASKMATLTFRIEPSLKDALRTTSKQGYRSIANMVAVKIWGYCGRNNVAITALGDLFVENHQNWQEKIITLKTITPGLSLTSLDPIGIGSLIAVVPIADGAV
jgi:hypothetical protein